MYCGTCMVSIEDALAKVPGVTRARVNLTTKRVSVTYDPSRTSTERLIETLDGIGFPAAELIESSAAEADARDRDFLKRLGVAGFAAANVMLLSVSVWAGVAGDMTESVRSMFHWLSALIALPAIAYSGQPFFRSALQALRGRRLNMDVPISLGVVLAATMSVLQTTRGSDQVYFDAAITLLFFLLIGRYLDQSMRTRAAGAAANLLGLKATTATVLDDDGTTQRLSARSLKAGDRILVAAGERFAADGVVEDGTSEVEESLITGESVPRRISRGATIYAGTLNGAGAVIVRTTAADQSTLLAEIARLMDAAEQGRGRYVRLADRAARLYAPAVHILSAATFAGWMVLGHGWEAALTAAIAVLIITCPCALALAVPAVQVAATSRLMRQGVIVKTADGLERLADADTIVFDKTGTLSLGEPELIDTETIPPDALSRAAALAANSRHPYSRALVRAATARGFDVVAADGVREVPGLGLECSGAGKPVSATLAGHVPERLGAPSFVGRATTTADDDTSILGYRRPDGEVVTFRFADTLRPDAREIVSTLKDAGYAVHLLSGDRASAVAAAADKAGIDDFASEIGPAGKLRRIEELTRTGAKVLMIGDGLNDAPALAAGHASMSPANAADISQTAADTIFQGQKLRPIVETLSVARASQRMALQNFAIALGYNLVFVPLAMLGHVTPLVAAIAMSASSIAVTGNAIRLKSKRLELRR
ncbi:MAG: heavy metal translocating P-type ATPase [Hyphomicrobiaceae bacterium]|nr:heavy metal translocating P-type ATPase [Hyphomicrobiaceae bacterium]